MSRFVTTKDGGRIAKQMIGSVRLHGDAIFINDTSNDLIARLQFDDGDEARQELISINEQLDAIEQVPARRRRKRD